MYKLSKKLVVVLLMVLVFNICSVGSYAADAVWNKYRAGTGPDIDLYKVYYFGDYIYACGEADSYERPEEVGGIIRRYTASGVWETVLDTGVSGDYMLGMQYNAEASVYIALSMYTGIYISTDGYTWVAVPDMEAVVGWGSVFDGERFVVLCGNTLSWYVSENGVEWEQSDATSLFESLLESLYYDFDNLGSYCLFYCNSRYVFMFSYDDEEYNEYYGCLYSTDLINWTKEFYDESLQFEYLPVLGEGVFYGVVYDANGYDGVVYKSVDGLSWTAVGVVDFDSAFYDTNYKYSELVGVFDVAGLGLMMVFGSYDFLLFTSDDNGNSWTPLACAVDIYNYTYDLCVTPKGLFIIDEDFIWLLAYDTIPEDDEARILVNGYIEPTVITFSVPTQTTFMINPNAEEAEDVFYAPNFTVLNTSVAPLKVEVVEFTATEDSQHVFQDVLPTAHANWQDLSKAATLAEIALALKKVSPDGWYVNSRDLLYAAEVTQPVLLGILRPKSAATFTLQASHGYAFEERLYPSYRVVFVFSLT